MAEYIKRADAMTICERYSNHCFEQNDSHGQHIADGIFDDIVELPTADVVEVVRCKDCKHCELIYPRKDFSKEAVSFYFCNVLETLTEPDHFCSYGERNENNAK